MGQMLLIRQQLTPEAELSALQGSRFLFNAEKWSHTKAPQVQKIKYRLYLDCGCANAAPRCVWQCLNGC